MPDREFWDAQAKVDAYKAVWSEPVDRTNECVQIALNAFSSDGFDENFLDLGCGCGRVTIPLARAMPSSTIYGIDISPEMVSYAPFFWNGECTVCEDGEIPFDDDFFDGIFSMLVFQHLTDEQVQAYLNECYRVLVPGGVLCFQFVVGRIYTGRDRRRSIGHMTEMVGSAGFGWPALSDSAMFPEWAWVNVKKP